MGASFGENSSPDRLADEDRYYCLLCHLISSGEDVRKEAALQAGPRRVCVPAYHLTDIAERLEKHAFCLRADAALLGP